MSARSTAMSLPAAESPCSHLWCARFWIFRCSDGAGPQPGRLREEERARREQRRTRQQRGWDAVEIADRTRDWAAPHLTERVRHARCGEDSRANVVGRPPDEPGVEERIERCTDHRFEEVGH